jgi:hypothetical protein
MNKFDRFDKPFRVLPTFDEKKGLELFNLASKLDTHELLQYSLDNQIPLDYTNAEGECLIHEVINIDSRKASEHAKLNVIKFLIQNRVNPDKSNKNNQTPLHLACKQQLVIIVEYLLKLGVDPNFQDNMGNTPLHYLFTGLVKTMSTSSEVMDFVPPPKKQDLKKNESIVKIKKMLWTYIQTLDLPMLESLKNTINNILKVDSDIVNRQLETNKQIVKMISDTSAVDKSAEVKDIIMKTKNMIHKKILKLFNELPKLPNFEIHNKTSTSWSPVSNPNLSLISSGNIRTEIKNDMERIRNNVIDKGDNFNPIPFFNETYTDDGFEQLMIEKIIVPTAIKTGNYTSLPDHEQFYATDNLDLLELDRFDSINDEIRHWLALDNASDIICFTGKKYMGGPRLINIGRPASLINNLLELVQINNDSLLILYLLFNFKRTGLVIKFVNDGFDILTPTNVYLLFNDINPNNIYGIIEATLKNSKHTEDYCFLIIMAYTAIFHPNNIDSVTTIKHNTDMNLDFNDNLFAQKWYGIYKNTPNLSISSWIYGMICDCDCKNSENNLNGNINLDLLLLIAGLSINKTNRIQSFINAYKPHIIAEIIGNESYDPLKLAKPIITLMNFNFDNVFLSGIDANSNAVTDSNPNNVAIQYINSLQISDDLKKLGELLLEWYNYISQRIGGGLPIRDFTTNNQLYKQFYKLGMTPKNVIIKIILSLNEQAENKLMEQTIIDLVYLIKNIDTSSVPKMNASILKFKDLSAIELFGPPDYSNPYPLFNLILEKNYMPSEYSKMNYIFDKKSVLGSFHIYRAHILGLYYQGMVYKTAFNLNQPINLNLESSINFKLSSYMNPSDNNYYHYLIDNQSGDTQHLGNNQLPFILNYVWLDHTSPKQNQVRYDVHVNYIQNRRIITNTSRQNIDIYNELTYNAKYYYYDINESEFRIPTHNAYANNLLNRIFVYQDKLKALLKTEDNSVENIINDIIKGRTTDIDILYIHIYPQLVFLSNILKGLIESYENCVDYYRERDNGFFKGLLPNSMITKRPDNYNYVELARALNKINSNYYIYYYLYQPGKLVGLSRFNYYQIPIGTATKSYYYQGDGTIAKELVDIASGNEQKIDLINDAANTESNDHKDSRNQILEEGYINAFDIGNYASILADYMIEKLPTINKQSANDFLILKSSPLPPSLYASLYDFYKYALIELVKDVLKNIESKKMIMPLGPVPVPEKQIYDETNKLIKTTGIAIESYELSTYAFIMNIVQELIQEQVSIYINNTIIQKYSEFISNKSQIVSNSIILPTKDMSVNLTLSGVELKKITDIKHAKNMFSLVTQPPKSETEPFVIYPNDLTNINKLRSKYGIVINHRIAEKLMEHNASLYITNADGYSTIFSIIKNYNYKLIGNLKTNQMIDFRAFYDSPLEYIKKENLNNLEKIFDFYDISKDEIKKLFSNIDGYLYNDVKSMITANDLFGNNILLYLQESFNMSTYLTLHYLSNSLDYKSNISFGTSELSDIMNLIGLNTDDLSKNFLGENMTSFNVSDDINNVIIQQFIDTQQKELDNVLDEISKLDKKDDDLKKMSSIIHRTTHIKGSHLYIQLTNRKADLETTIIQLRRYLTPGVLPKLSSSKTDLFEVYNEYNTSKDRGLLMLAWSKLLEKQINSNYNLIPIFVLDKQKKIIEGTINPADRSDLGKIGKVMNHWASLGEKYFTDKKFTENNETLKFIEKLLIYITQMVIGNGIELMLRKILMTWLLNSSINEMPDYDEINDTIDYILTEELIGMDGKNMLNELYDTVCLNLVKNSAEIFENKSEEQAHNLQNTKEILLNYFQLLDLTPWGDKIPTEVKNIFYVQVTNYFDTITSKSILLWFVNVENILKFLINNYRCLETLLSII